MRALVAYESLFGNTRAIAEAVAAGLADAAPDAVVQCLPVTEPFPDADGADVLAVGGPTHFWGATSALSRVMERQYERRICPHVRIGAPRGDRQAAETRGVREWLTDVPPGAGRAAAAFDTRIDRPLTGGAAVSIARRLRRRGYRLVAGPQPFVVEHVAGPLRRGELARARAWGASLADEVQHSVVRAVPLESIKEPAAIGESLTVPPKSRWETIMSTTAAVADGRSPSDTPTLASVAAPTNRARSTAVPVAGAATRERTAVAGGAAHGRIVDLTRVLTTAEVVVGAVLVARQFARRPSPAHAHVTMGPGGWVSMKGGTVAVRPARRPFGRPRPIPPAATAGRVPIWARVISAVPLQRLIP